ncbi:MAG: PIN domain-containing protein [Candidatus Micrarchaeota archaeon]
MKNCCNIFDLNEYSSLMHQAKSICPDPDDIQYFALALKLGCPIWSNDKALKEQNTVEVISTGELIDNLAKSA